MRLTTISPEAQQKVAVFVPIIALAVSLFVVYPAYGRYRDLLSANDKSRAELQELQNAPIPPVGSAVPALDDSPTEGAAFLGQVRQMAAASGCNLVGFDGSVQKTGEVKEGSGVVRPVVAKVDVEGDYKQIRSFLWQVSHSNRMLAVTDFDLKFGTNGRLQASITIERYLTIKEKT